MPALLIGWGRTGRAVVARVLFGGDLKKNQLAIELVDVEAASQSYRSRARHQRVKRERWSHKVGWPPYRWRKRCVIIHFVFVFVVLI